MEHKTYVLICSTNVVWSIFHSNKKWARYDKSVYWSSCKLPVIPVVCLENLWFSRQSLDTNIKFHENPSSGNRVPCRWKTWRSKSDVYWTMHHCDNWRIKNQQDATYYFIVLLIGSTCFGHYYAHHQELATIMFITLVVSFLVSCRLEVRCD